MQIEYKELRCGFNYKVNNKEGEVKAFIHAEYDDELDLMFALFKLANMVVNDEL